jgi:hypothetical protein
MVDVHFCRPYSRSAVEDTHAQEINGAQDHIEVV